MRATKTKVAVLKVLVFVVGDLHLAVRLDGIKKVIPMPEIFKSGDKLLGIAHFEEQEALVLDLFQKIYGQAATKDQGYLIVIEAAHSLYGLTVERLPMLKSVPLSEFRPVPSDYRTRDSLGITEQMAQIPDKDQTVTIFLLDQNRLLQLVEENR